MAEFIKEQPYIPRLVAPAISPMTYHFRQFHICISFSLALVFKINHTITFREGSVSIKFDVSADFTQAAPTVVIHVIIVRITITVLTV